MENIFTFVVDEENKGKRLDVFLVDCMTETTRSLVQQWIDEGFVLCDQLSGLLKASQKVQVGFVFRVTIPKPVDMLLTPLQMDLDVYFEDEHLLVLNKPAGLTVHSGAGHINDTLVNGLLYHCKDLSGIGGVLRPGIVHRLDKDTSGLMVVAKHDKAHNGLSLQFQEKGEKTGIERQYIGFSWSTPNPLRGRIETIIGRHPKERQKMAVLKGGGKESVTDYKTVEIIKTGFMDCSKVEFTLLTGRTHQIRVHCLHLKIPLIGDPIYGRSIPKNSQSKISPFVLRFHRQALHAKRLAFIHPITKERLDFESPLPEDMMTLEKELNDS